MTYSLNLTNSYSFEYINPRNLTLPKLANKPRLCIIGSARLQHGESRDTCKYLGTWLAEQLPNLALLTGGVSGAGEGVGRSFNKIRGNTLNSDVFHLVPYGSPRWDYGTTLFAGSNSLERRAILAASADAFIVIEGSSGTVHEAFLATARLATLIPIARLGGHAAVIYHQTPRPDKVSAELWEMLANTQVPVLDTVTAVVEIVKIYLPQALIVN